MSEAPAVEPFASLVLYVPRLGEDAPWGHRVWEAGVLREAADAVREAVREPGRGTRVQFIRDNEEEVTAWGWVRPA